MLKPKIPYRNMRMRILALRHISWRLSHLYIEFLFRTVILFHEGKFICFEVAQNLKMAKVTLGFLLVLYFRVEWYVKSPSQDQDLVKRIRK